MKNNLREIRKAKGLTLHELHRLTGYVVSVASLSQIENGINKPGVDTALRLAIVLETTVEELFGPLVDDQVTAADDDISNCSIPTETA